MVPSLTAVDGRGRPIAPGLLSQFNLRAPALQANCDGQFIAVAAHGSRHESHLASWVAVGGQL